MINKAYANAKVGHTVTGAGLEEIDGFKQTFTESIESLRHLDKVRFRVITKLSKLSALSDLFFIITYPSATDQNFVVCAKI